MQSWTDVVSVGLLCLASRRRSAISSCLFQLWVMCCFTSNLTFLYLCDMLMVHARTLNSFDVMLNHRGSLAPLARSPSTCLHSDWLINPESLWGSRGHYVLHRGPIFGQMVQFVALHLAEVGIDANTSKRCSPTGRLYAFIYVNNLMSRTLEYWLPGLMS